MEHKYGCLHRPAMPGTVPGNGIVGIVDTNKCNSGYFSVVTYSRKLTDAEISHYELEVIDKTETIQIPAVNFDPDVYFTGTEQEQKEYERQCVKNMSTWKNILKKRNIATVQFTGNGGITYILHPSTREGVTWQLSRLDHDGVFIGHTDYVFDSPKTRKELYETLRDVSMNGAAVSVEYI